MEEKIEELIDIYKQQIYSLCYKLSKEDEKRRGRYFQETWIKVFSSRGTNFLTWRIIKMDYYNLYFVRFMIFYRKRFGKIEYWICFIKRMGGEIDFADDVNISEEFIQKWKRK